jgi:predicted ATPase/DNA-binding SARP family transcriptional activator
LEVEFHILGPLAVVDDGGQLVDVGSHKQRAVLAVLALSANRAVALDRLVDELWGDEPPAAAIGSLQAYISNLRRTLEPGRGPRQPPTVLITQPPGYLLRVEENGLDAARFEQAVADGRRLLDGGRPSAAYVRLSESLALWRGPVLADFSSYDFARVEVARLDALRLVAAEERIAAALTLGQHTTAVCDAEAMVATHPLRERGWGLLMVALYRSGRQADALRSYQAARHVLGEELGIEPGPALRRLESDILAQVTSLDWQKVEIEVDADPTLLANTVSLVPNATTARPLVGRVRELSRLNEMARRAAGGRGGVVLVTGEPGIGKTRLVEELIRGPHSYTTAWGGAVEGGGTPAYWPWLGVLRSLLDHDDREAVVSAIGSGAAELAQIVPEINEITGAGEAPPAPDPETARLHLFEAVAGFLGALARRRPMVVIFDDLQWADTASLQLLGLLAARISCLPLLVVGTYREAEIGHDHSLRDTLAVLARHQVVERVPLSGLSGGEVGALIAQTTGAPAIPEVAAAVLSRTEGNPFFVTELAKLLASEQRSLAGAIPDSLPAGVCDVVRRRLRRLPDETTTILSMAAVAGKEFDLDVLESAVALDGDRTLVLIEAALLGGLVFEHPAVIGRFRFSHDLVREAILDELSAMRRARMHVRLGEAIEARHGISGPHVIELAHHFAFASSSADADKAIGYALAAAETSKSGLAHEQAQQLLRGGLALLTHLPAGERRDRRELECVLLLSTVLMRTRGYSVPEAGELLARANALCQQLDEGATTMPVLWSLLSFQLVGARHRAARAMANAVLAIAKASGRPVDLVAGDIAVGVTALHTGEFGVARDHLAAALRAPEALRDPWLISWMLIHPAVCAPSFLAIAQWALGEPQAARALIEQMIATSIEIGDDLTTAHALLMETWVAALEEDAERTADLGAKATAFALERELHLYVGASSALHGWARAVLGDAGGVEQMKDALAAMEGAGALMMHTHLLALLADSQRCAGMASAALQSAERGLEIAGSTGQTYGEVELHRLLGELLLEVPPVRRVESQAELERAVELARAQGAVFYEARAEASLARSAAVR